MGVPQQEHWLRILSPISSKSLSLVLVLEGSLEHCRGAKSQQHTLHSKHEMMEDHGSIAEAQVVSNTYKTMECKSAQVLVSLSKKAVFTS
jgi:hypothetical protein